MTKISLQEHRPETVFLCEFHNLIIMSYAGIHAWRLCCWRDWHLSPNNQRQHRTLHMQKDVLPYALCYLLCPVSADLASIRRMDSISTSYTLVGINKGLP